MAPVDTAYPWLDDMQRKGRVAAELLSRRPEGQRVLLSVWLPKLIYASWPTPNPLDNCATAEGIPTNQPCIWRTNGIAAAAAKYTEFFEAYRAAGGPTVDSLIVDYEDFNFPTGNSDWQNAMLSDPRFRRGSSDFPADDFRRYAMSYLLGVDLDNRSASMIFNPPWASPLKGMILNYLGATKIAAIDTAAFDTARRFHPSIKGSDWLAEYVDQRRFFVPEGNGHAYPQNPDSNYPISQLNLKMHFGTHQATATYHSLGQIAWPLRNILLDGSHTFTARPHDSLLYNVNRMRANKLSSNVPLYIWIPSRSYFEEEMQSYGGFNSHPDLYQESILHAALLNPEQLLFWNIDPPGENSAPLVDSVLVEFNQLLGNEPRRTLVEDRNCNSVGVSTGGIYPERCLLPWDADYVLSGVEVGSRRIYRITADTDYVDAAAAFHVISDNSGVTVSTETASIRFDAAVVYAPARTRAPGGVWIVSRSDAPEPRVEYHGTVPFVNAGIDTEIKLPTNAAVIFGSASYKYPGDVRATAIPVTWTQLSGPFEAQISDPHNPRVTITCPVEGNYRFRVSATAGGVTRFDDVTLRVLPPDNTPNL